MLRIERRLRRALRALPAGPLLVAVSGGLDSTVLGYLSAQERDVVWCYVRHGLRSTTAQRRDERHLRLLAQRLGVRLRVAPIAAGAIRATAKDQGRSVEEVAREHRYRLLTAIAHEEQAATILTGHHIQDSIETVLMRLAGGRGWTGVHGVPVERTYRGVRLFRPFLAVGEPYPTRQDLLEIAVAAALPHVEDTTNNENRYLRNRVRHELLPLLRQQFGLGVDRSVVRFAAELDRVRAWVEEEAQRQLPWAEVTDNAGHRFELGAARFFSAPALLREQAVRNVLYRCSLQEHRLSTRAFAPLLRDTSVYRSPTTVQLHLQSGDAEIVVHAGVVVVRTRLVRYLQSGYLWPISSSYRGWKIEGLQPPAVARQVQYGDRLPEGNNRGTIKLAANGVGEVVEDRQGIAAYWRGPDSEPFFLRSDLNLKRIDTPHDGNVGNTEGEDSLEYAE